MNAETSSIVDNSRMEDESFLYDDSKQTTGDYSTVNDSVLSSQPSQPTRSKNTKLNANYFDIDDILALNERIPCQIEQDLFKMGYLDQSTDDEHLAKGTKLELPLWFAKEFHSQQIKVIKVEAPKGYNEIFRQIFDADASVVNLNKISMNFYRFGEHLVDLEFKDSEEIAHMLEKTFEKRIHHVLNYSLNVKSELVDDGINFKKKLDNLETKLYNIGRKELTNYQRWEENQLHKIDTNELVINLKKRKQAASTAGLYKN